MLGDIMVTINNLKKQLKENMNDKSKDELYSLTESLVAEFYKAVADDDLQRMKEINATMDDFKSNLKGKYDNVDAVFNGLELQKQKEYYVLQQHQYNLLHSKDRILIYQLLIHEITAKLYYLKRILCFYFTHAIKDGGNVNDLDGVIANIRDDIIDLSGVADMYFKDDTPDGVNLDIETSKEIIHDVYNNDFLDFLKENGMVEIQMQMINIHKLNYNCNNDYKKLKLEIDELFGKNNGFKKISESFIRMVKNETNVNASADAIINYLPEYDIASAKFIPPEFPDIVEN